MCLKHRQLRTPANFSACAACSPAASLVRSSASAAHATIQIGVRGHAALRAALTSVPFMGWIVMLALVRVAAAITATFAAVSCGRRVSFTASGSACGQA